MVKLSIVFHPQVDGQVECTIQTLKYMLRPCIIYLKGSWDWHLTLLEFAYNNTFHRSIYMAPCESFYGKRWTSSIGWFKVCAPSLLGPDFIYKTLEKVHIIRNRWQTAYSRQKSYVGHKRRDLLFEERDKVYLKISPMKGGLDLARKGNWVLVMWVPTKSCKRLVRFPMNWNILVNWLRFIRFPCFYVEKVCRWSWVHSSY